MLRAIFFDFNGVLVDDEPLHFSLFQKTLEEKSILLTSRDYYQKYLGYDDRDCFTAILRDQKIPHEKKMIEALIQRKAELYFDEAQTKDLFIANSVSFVKKVSEKYFLGVVSGALRQEIEGWLERGEIRSLFPVIVSAQDVKRGKPDPEGYLKGLDLLNRDFVSNSDVILPQECLVIEDSMWGIEAAHSAGMKCLALATSYPKESLTIADWVVQNFGEIHLETLEHGFKDLS